MMIGDMYGDSRMLITDVHAVTLEKIIMEALATLETLAIATISTENFGAGLKLMPTFPMLLIVCSGNVYNIVDMIS